MKIIMIWTILFFAPLYIKAQKTKIISGIDTTSINIPKWEKDRKKEFKITELTRFNGDSAFRFYNCRQFVEILYNKGRIIGKVISFAQEYHRSDSQVKRKKVHIRETVLDSLLLSKVRLLINESQIASIPSGRTIKAWKYGCDGIIYDMEYVNATSYSFKSYWTPTAQDSTLFEAKQIQHFVDSLETTLNLQQKYNIFFADLPTGSYRVGEMMVWTKIKLPLKYRLRKFWDKTFNN